MPSSTLLKFETRTSTDHQLSQPECAQVLLKNCWLIRAGGYVLRPYNFYINPIPVKEDYNRVERIWSYQSGGMSINNKLSLINVLRSRAIVLAVSFLLKNKFRFDLPFSEGITYLSRKEEGQIRASWAVRDAERAALEDMAPKVDDKPLIDHIHVSVQKWLSQPLVEREDYLNIPHTTEEKRRIKHIPALLNRYQVRLTHQVIRKDYASLRTTGKDGFVRITTRNEKEDAEHKLRQEQYREQDVIQAIEFRWVVEALCGGDITKIPERCFLAAMPEVVKSKGDNVPHKRYIDELQHKLSTRRRVIFGHNCFTDMIYLYACFIGDPPERVEDFQELVHTLFPAVVDTKYLASFAKELRFNSNLQAVEKVMQAEKVPVIEVPAAYDRYVWGEHFHEAGFDSFVTAKIAIKLSAKLEREGKLRELAKPEKLVKARETIVIDENADAEDDEQAEDYVTAPESEVESDSVFSKVVSRISGVFVTSAAPIPISSQGSSGKSLSVAEQAGQAELRGIGDFSKFVGQDQEAEAERGPFQQPEEATTRKIENAASETSASDALVVGVKEKTVDWQGPAKEKRIKNVFVHKNSFEVLDIPSDPSMDRTESEHQTVIESVPRNIKEAKSPEVDLLIWSDKDGEEAAAAEDEGSEEGGSGDTGNQSVPIQDERPEPRLTAEELKVKLDEMAANGEMMPRWESESGIWKVLGNKMLVNACEEGVCLL
jgi:CAF1 family ribonuclease